MAIELVLTLGNGVLDGVENGFVVVCPGDGANALRVFGKVLAGAEILNGQGVLAEAGVVRGVGKQVAVVTDFIFAQGNECLTLAEFV